MTSIKKPNRQEDITVILLGPPGSGKTATGNTLTDSNCNITWHIFETSFTFNFAGRDNDYLTEMGSDMERLIRHIEERKFQGVTIFLLVLDLSNRFTMFPSVFEKLLGKVEFWKHCIIVLTKQDVLGEEINRFINNEENKLNEFTGDEKTRIVQICNIAGHQLYASSKENLISEIVAKKNSEKCYTLKNYMNNFSERNKHIALSEYAKMSNKYVTEIQQITNKRKQASNAQEIYIVLQTIVAVESEIEKNDRQSGVFAQFKYRLQQEKECLMERVPAILTGTNSQ